mgnify:CR=1 FL=1
MEGYLFTSFPKRFINRDWDRASVKDDWALNVQPILERERKQSLPVTAEGINSDAKEEDILGWMIS